MNENSNVMIKNASVLFVSQIITWVFGFLIMIVLPRYIGPTGAGQFAIASALWMILGNLISFGSDSFLIKEIARKPEKAGGLMVTVLVMRGIIYLMSCGGLAIYLYFMNYPLEILLIILIFGVAELFAQIGHVNIGVLRGIERMEYISLTDIITKAVNVALVFLIIALNLGIYAIASISVITTICSWFIQSKGIRKYVKIQFSFDRSQVTYILRSSLPFVLSGLILTAYFQIDTLIMAAFVETHTMGWYSVALSVSGTFLFLPTILSSAIFPAFARTYGTETNASNRLLSKSIDLMFLFGIPIGFGLTSIATSIIPLLYGPAFDPATIILSLMGFVLVFSYLATVIGQYMVATEKIHIWTTIMVVAVIITIPLDIWLIPLCDRMLGNGAIGGAITFLLTEFGMAAAGMLLLPRGMLQWSNVRVAVSTFVIGLCMMGVCWLVRDQFLAVPIILGGLTYVSLILLLHVIPHEDIVLLTEAVRGLVDRVRKRQVKPNTPSEAEA